VATGQAVLTAVLVLIAVVLVSAAVEAAQYFTLNRAAEEVVFGLRSTIVARVLRLPMSAYLAMRDGDIAARVTSDTTLVRAVITSGAVELLGSGLIAVGAVVGMGVIDPVLTLVVVLILLSTVATSMLFGRSIQVHSSAAQAGVGALAADLNRSMAALSTIRASNATEGEAVRLRAHAHTAKDAGLRLARASAILVPANRIATQLAFAVILAVGGWRVIEGTISVADLIAFIMLLFLLVNPLGQVVRAYMAVQTALGAMGRIEGLVSHVTEDEDEDPNRLLQLPDGLVDVQFDDVHFSYRAETPILKGVSMDVRAGELCAVVGESGAGKSTMFALLERFYEPDAGHIRFGGMDIAAIARSDVRDRLAYVEQSSPILAGTLRENLLLGGTRASDPACEAALRDTRLGHLIGAGTQGLDSAVGEGGKMLSGGERQRLAIARALLTKKPVLLLDEPSSSLDAANEEILRGVLRTLRSERTTIVITHRLSTVRDADRVYRLHHGRIDEGGVADEGASAGRRTGAKSALAGEAARSGS
jgi:ABC-type multidrug transport system fused ATPase/permease subunit